MRHAPSLRARLRRALLGCALLGAAGACLAEPAPLITWTVRDMAPFNIMEGPLKGQGIADRMLGLLQQRLPQYRHLNSRVNRARANQMFARDTLTCDAGVLRTQEREQLMYFSIPTLGVVTNGVVVRQEREAQMRPFLHDGKIDLAAFLADPHQRLGVLVERSYGPAIDATLHAAPPERLLVHHGNNALGSLLQMQEHGRISALLGYWPEVRYLAETEGMEVSNLRFYPVQGMPSYLLAHVGCSKTPEGKKAIEAINQVIRELRGEELIQLYARWLDGPTREAYLKDAKGFFEKD
ncbi:TIGR02285 family protein [Pseudomonas sp. zfem005]|uniref:TIGR02285 family protein n=1 Tax=Pseudomonas sp. zfem005 TaxID=3078200 RepID=UPI0029292496|nr:TIGR02285 family protein [Pseudomonas sp. zfem005]MDU9412429.1 TIGR02285 family protein [Pseudomonas sp. zfem005]